MNANANNEAQEAREEMERRALTRRWDAIDDLGIIDALIDAEVINPDTMTRLDWMPLYEFPWEDYVD